MPQMESYFLSRTTTLGLGVSLPKKQIPSSSSQPLCIYLCYSTYILSISLVFIHLSSSQTQVSDHREHILLIFKFSIARINLGIKYMLIKD